MALTGRLAKCLLISLLVQSPAIARTQVSAQPSASSSSDPKASVRPIRVRTDVESFHLDRRPGTAPNQVGAASRGNHTVLVLCAPNSGLASAPRPVFVWQTPATSPGPVHFSLVNAGGEVLFETEVAGTHLEYPLDAPPLTPGDTFAWTVSGHGGTDKLPAYVQFEVQAKPERDNVVRQLADSPADPLARAQVFLAHQVWYDAVAELEKGLQTAPNRKDLTQQLQGLYRQVASGCAESVP